MTVIFFPVMYSLRAAARGSGVHLYVRAVMYIPVTETIDGKLTSN
jgi:hypothetical protein